MGNKDRKKRKVSAVLSFILALTMVFQSALPAAAGEMELFVSEAVVSEATDAVSAEIVGGTDAQAEELFMDTASESGAENADADVTSELDSDVEDLVDEASEPESMTENLLTDESAENIGTDEAAEIITESADTTEEPESDTEEFISEAEEEPEFVAEEELISEEEEASVDVFSAGLEAGTTDVTTTGSLVGFAGLTWYVIGKNDGSSTAGVYTTPSNSVTLLAKTGQSDWKDVPFRSKKTNSTTGYSYYKKGDTKGYYANNPSGMSKWSVPNEYAGSTLQQTMEDIAAGIKEASEGEYDLINARTLQSSDGIAGQTVKDQKLWALSKAEWSLLDKKTRGYSGYWWLRSSASQYGYQVYEGNSSSSDTDLYYSDAGYTGNYVRPALNLNLSNVMFTSSADSSGKSSATVGGKLVGASSVTGTIKYTVQSTGQKLTVSATEEQQKQTAATLSFYYSGATTGTNQYVSCVLVNESGVAAYYGKLANSSAAAGGNLSVPLTGVSDGTYVLKIFSEQANGDLYTDFASEPVTMTVSVSNGKGTVSNFTGQTVHIVTFDMQNHGSAIDAQIVVSGWKAAEPTEPTDADYDFGGWYKETECTTAWDFADDTVTADTVLYAKWTKKHVHSWTYTADGAKLTVACSGDSSHTASLTISAQACVYTGSEQKTAVLSDTSAWTGYGLTVPEIVYSGDVVNVTDAGVTASITAGETTASVNYKITSAALTAGGTAAVTEVYGKPLSEISVPALTASLGDTAVSGTWTWDYNDTYKAETILNASSTAYTVTAKFTPDSGNYAGLTKDVAVTITKAEYTGVIAEDEYVHTEKEPQWYTYDFTTALAGLDGAKITAVAIGTNTDGVLNADTAYAPTFTDKTISFYVNNIADENKTATLNVTVESTNYADFTATLKIITEHRDDAKVSVTGIPLSVTYGDADFTLTAVAGNAGNSVIGWTWKSSDESILTVTPDSSDASKAIVHIVKANANGATITAKYESDTTIGDFQADIIVNPKHVTITGVTAADKIYDGTTATAITGTAAIKGKLDADADALTITAGTASFEDANAGKNKTVTFTGFSLGGTAAGNYTLSAQPDSVKATISQKNITLTVDDISAQTYTGSQLTPAVSVSATDVISGETLTQGTDYTVAYGENITVTSGGTVTISPVSTSNYTFTAVTETFTIQKADPSYTAPQAAEGLIYDGSALTLVKEGSTQDGTISYKLGESGEYSQELPTATDAETYTVYWKLSGDANHTDVLENSISVSIGKATNEWTSELTMYGWIYGHRARTPDAAAKFGTVSYSYYRSSGGEVLAEKPEEVGVYQVKAVVAETDNYTGLTDCVSFQIAKADPTCDPPTGLTAVYGQTLADVTLENPAGNTPGTWTWLNSAQDVGEASDTAKTFIASFTPDDTDNYNSVTAIEVSVTVKKASAPEITWPTAGAITYGEKLSQSTLDTSNASTQYGGFAWTDPDAVLEAGERTAKVTFTVNSDTAANYETITETTKDIAITVKQESPAITLNEDSIAGSGDTRTVTLSAAVTGLSGEGLKSPSGSVTFTAVNAATGETATIGTATIDAESGKAAVTWNGAAHDTVYTVTAAYGGDTNYTSASETLEVDTARQPQSIAIADPGTKTYGDTAFMLSLSNAGSGTGAVTWSVVSGSDYASIDSATGEVTIKGAGEATVKVLKAADDTYNQAEAEIKIEIDKLALTVTAKAAEKTYGESDPTAFTYTVKSNLGEDAEAYAAGDTESSVLTGALTRTSGENVGTYEITEGSLALTETGAKNYTLTFKEGTFTIHRAALTAEGAAFSASYGSELSEIFLPLTAKLGENTVSGTWAWVYTDSMTAETVLEVSDTAYSLTAKFTPAGGAENYEELTQTVSLTITKADAPEITWPTAGAITYGEKLSQSTLDTSNASTQYGGFAWTDPDAVLEAGERTANVTFTVNSDTAANYETITETTKDIAITVKQESPAITLNEDSIAGSGDTRTVTLSAAVTGLSGEGLKAPSGSVTFTAVNAATGETVTIGMATIDAESGKAAVTWNGAAHDTVYTVTAAYAGDTNYTPASETLEVDTARQPQSIAIADPGTKTYGDTAFTLGLSNAGSGTGAVTWSVVSGSDYASIDSATGKVTIKGAGEATVKVLKAADDTYNQAEAEIKIEIDKLALTVTAKAAEKIYGESDPTAFTYTVKSNLGEDAEAYAAGDTESSVLTGALTRTSGENVGTYEITEGSLALTETGAKNYTLTFAEGIFTIMEKAPESTSTTDSTSASTTEPPTTNTTDSTSTSTTEAPSTSTTEPPTTSTTEAPGTSTTESTTTSTTEPPTTSTTESTAASTTEPTTAGHTHTYGAWTVTKSPAVGVKGSKKRTCSICGKVQKKEIAALKKPSLLLAKGVQKSTRSIKLTWKAVSGAEGYEIYWSTCDGKSNYKLLKRTTKRSYTHGKRNASQTYKYIVKAYKTINGKKTYIAKSPSIHVAMKKNNETNVKKLKLNTAKLTLSVGKTFKIKASVTKQNKKKSLVDHTAAYRYYSTDKNIATVTKNGKITAKAKGTCWIYVVAPNGLWKSVKVTVR